MRGGAASQIISVKCLDSGLRRSKCNKSEGGTSRAHKVGNKWRRQLESSMRAAEGWGERKGGGKGKTEYNNNS